MKEYISTSHIFMPFVEDTKVKRITKTIFFAYRDMKDLRRRCWKIIEDTFVGKQLLFILSKVSG